MSFVKVKIDKYGKIKMDFEGFVQNDCDVAEQKIKEKIKSMQMKNQGEHRKEHDDYLMEVA